MHYSHHGTEKEFVYIKIRHYKFHGHGSVRYKT